MKRDEVKIGGVYTTKVTDKLVPVRIDAESPHGGWDGTNLSTGKKVHIKGPQRLREEVKADGAKPACPNCGSTEVDEDGDCAKCREPGVAKSAPEKGKRAEKATTSPTAATDGKKTPKATTKARPKKAATRAKQGQQKTRKPSGLDAAARVLAESKEPMTCRQIVEVAFDKGYWKSGGKTPHATIYSAMIREIAAKGKDSRFKKVDRGKFAANPGTKG